MINFLDILKNGTTISSSGTSGQKKLFYQSPKKLEAANKVAVQAQKISPTSKIYTCCKTDHAGGLLAQTLPAMSIGAEVSVVPFNAYAFVKEITNFTHTHITPLHAKAITLTKGFKNLDLSNLWVTCGAEPVSWDIIEAFVGQGACFMVNWGMSEVGPIAINVVFENKDDVVKYRQLAPPNTVIIGDTKWCEYKIQDNELLVKGDICIYDNWYQTKDKVVEIDGVLFYQGRIDIEIDLWNLKKG